MKLCFLKKSFFPEYDVKTLHLKKDKFVIINRVLEYGGINEIRNLFKIYKSSEIKKFVINYGIKKLSLKSLNFWLHFFDVKNKNKLIKTKIKNKYWNL
ncbi:MAG: hypothetical protein NZ928_03535 [Endomicrobia bacterium]|nr:hypothetical protein [Endomicrobiia bacterium]MDW8055341.1 hypothetical protein [Elusimicrobiota bacterium]